ncbi:hypothetical protein ACFPOI_06850 [Nonomuraea angiospora]|uniref:HTH hxlR-type domain-containing protein n=1 Tax=Nonomuraea angiospora TaxID=46172 RepID=A0ABR9MCW5_9ACTN|nr:hypothetical protein [Nonomuraea angiospora]MBE1590738.1 hypothetical protein [Nonomuraea angiospora]
MLVFVLAAYLVRGMAWLHGTSPSSCCDARPAVTEGAVEKHISGIFPKLALGPAPEDHRRVPAVLTDLGRRRECAMAWDGWTIWHTGS